VLQPRGFPATRASLLNLLRDATDSVGWREFFEHYAPGIYRVARLRGIDPHEAEDIVQQVMLAISTHIKQFDYKRDRGQFRDWVRRITENKIISLRRRAQLPYAGSGDLENAEGDDQRIEAAWDRAWQLQDLNYCLEQAASSVSSRWMSAFRMYVLEGVPAAETARRMGMHVGYVYVIRNQVLNLVRQHMRSLGESEHPRESI
jgi:RNA polymerase sigma-70 factor (ECF subfamily)